jgi:hypothetical protein
MRCRNLNKLEKLTKQKFHRYSIDESIARQEHLGRLMDEDGKLIREPNQEEEEFILAKFMLCKQQHQKTCAGFNFKKLFCSQLTSSCLMMVFVVKGGVCLNNEAKFKNKLCCSQSNFEETIASTPFQKVL